MTAYRKSLGILIGFLIVVEGVLAIVFIGQPPIIGDESHLIHTIVEFGQGISLGTLQHYDQMSPPLPLILYALWGKALNFDPATLRWLSVIVALAAYLIFYDLVHSLCKDPRIALAATIFLALIPYMLGFSVYVLTDMWAILCVIVSFKAIQADQPVLLGIASAAGLLSRQYFAFVPAAGIAYYLAVVLLKGDKRAIHYLIALFLSTLPLLSLFVLWRGASPDDPFKNRYLIDAFYFHPSFFNLYVAIFPAYLFPFVLIRARSLYRNKWILLITALASIYYWFFPVAPSQVSLDMNIDTVGILDRAARVILGVQLDRFVFFGLFLLGLPIVLSIVQDVVSRFKRKQLDAVFLLDLSVLAFFVVMPFSYLGWEKYFMPVVPLAAAQMILKHREDVQARAFAPKPAPAQGS